MRSEVNEESIADAEPEAPADEAAPVAPEPEREHTRSVFPPLLHKKPDSGRWRALRSR